MNRKRSASKGKKINPHFWVFCEGVTEAAYVCFLRSKYRIPVDIVTKISGSNISEGDIRKYKQGKPTHKKDKDFLIYDSDVKDTLNRLKSIRAVTLIASSPSIELWFLLHYKAQTAHISTNECIKELSKRNRITYKKGILDERLTTRLAGHYSEACKRARNLTLYENPSSNMYLIIKVMEEAKK
ncbi:MAG: RloB domain-containing protein [Bacteroidales bacterium]|nr:RloB domain-containing protein [Bacteroidales bacterium]